MGNIDTDKGVRFFDDTGRDNFILYMDGSLYEDEKLCLCFVNNFTEQILFNKKTGEVLTTNYMFFYAENF